MDEIRKKVRDLLDKHGLTVKWLAIQLKLRGDDDLQYTNLSAALSGLRSGEASEMRLNECVRVLEEYEKSAVAWQSKEG